MKELEKGKIEPAEDSLGWLRTTLSSYKELLKQKQILRIIEEKEVNIGYFKHRIEHESDKHRYLYKEYQTEQSTPYLDIYVSNKLLNKTEFYLLKGWLKNGK